MNRKIFCIAAVISLSFKTVAANLTWVGGGEGDWNNDANWSPAQIPTQNDTVFFDSTEQITVNLSDSQAFATISVSNTPCLKFIGSVEGSEINVRQDSKWTLFAPIVFDEKTFVRFTAGKVWTNNSTIDFFGGVGCVSGSTPTFGGNGFYKVRGPVDFPSGVTISASVDWDPSSVTDATTINVASGDWQFNKRPTVENHLICFNGGTGGIGGTAPLWIASEDETRPAAGIKQWSNPNLYLRRTMPTVFCDWFALCLGESCNNNKVGFSLGSGANLWMPADITSANKRDFYAAEPVGGFKLVFKGCGSNVRLSGENSFQGGGATTEILCDNGCGYNSIEIDGEGDVIHPFGEAGGKLYSNCGHGVFIRPMRPGLTMANGLSYGNSVNNNNGYTFGFDGTNDLTVAGDLKLGTSYSKVPVIGDMTLTFTGSFDPNVKNFDFVGTGDVVLAPSSRYGGTTGTLNKHSSGKLILQGKLIGTGYNRAYFSGGETVLDYTQGNESRLNTANTENSETPVELPDALRLRGTKLVLKGGSLAESVGGGNGTTFQNGLTKICREGGSSSIYLGKIAPSATASSGNLVAVDFEDGVALVDTSLCGQNLKGTFTVGGDKFAKVDENGVVTAAEDSIATKYIGDNSANRSMADYIIFESTSDGQSFSWNGTGDGAFVANKDGMIFRGDFDYTINGGWIGGANTYGGGLVFTCAGNGVLTFTGKLNRYGFIKSGPGTFKHTGTSDLSQALSIYEGIFEVASENSFSPAGKGGYKVYLNGGVLRTSVDVTLERPMSIGDNGGTLEVAQGTVFTHTSTVETDSMGEGSSGPIVKKGAGVWQMTGEFKAQSELCIEEGVVRLGSAKGIGDSTAQVRSIAPTEILKNGTLDVAGFNSNVGNLYLRGGAIIDSAGGGSVGAYTFFAESGTVAVPLTNVICPNGNNYFVANNLVKTSSGTVELSAANTFTGTAFVHEGNLLLTGSLAGSCYVDGGTLEGSGSIAGYAYITKNGALTATPGAVLSLGDKLAVDGGGTLLVAANAGAVGTFELTSVDGAVYLGDAANLKFDLRDGSLGALAGEKVIVKIPEGVVVSGQFSNFVDGKYRDAFGNKYIINYSGGDGNDIALVSYGSGLSIIVR